MMTRILSLSFLTMFILGLYCPSLGQLIASYAQKSSCDCIEIDIHNRSKDTAYIYSQSNSIQYWDSCYAYSIFKRDMSSKIIELNMSYYYRDMDDKHHNTFFILPDSTLSFGARSNNSILKDSLFISVYMYAMPIKKEEGIKGILKRLDNLNKSKKIQLPWKWESYYCPPKTESKN